MTGWLVYSPEGVQRNQRFIDDFLINAKKLNIDLRLILEEDAYASPFPDFAIIRTMNFDLSVSLEKNGVAVFNPSQTSYICNDKWRTYLFASSLGLPIPRTSYELSPETVTNSDYPYVLKACDGHGGTQVYLITDSDSETTARFQLSQIPSVRQEFVSNPGKDLRVYVMGGRIISCMLRESDISFKSNFSLGGKAREIFPSKDVIEIVECISGYLNNSFIGIDFIFHNGKPLLNEIEDVVGCRMLYSKTDIDITFEYLKYIISKIN